MKRDDHNHVLLLVFAVIVVALLSAVYVYVRLAVNASLSRAITARDQAVVEQADKSHEQDLLSAYQSTAAERARLHGLLVPVGQEVSFIEDWEALGRQSGATVSLSAIDADPLQGAAVGTKGGIRASVEASGSWAEVMRALVLAEDFPYIVTISRVELNQSLSGGKNPARLWRASFGVQGTLIVASSTSA